MPFRKYQLTPEQVEPMRQAFGTLCQALDMNCQPEDLATDLLVAKIMDVAATGELDPKRICAKVLEQLRAAPLK
jgi:hypothetical protein